MGDAIECGTIGALTNSPLLYITASNVVKVVVGHYGRIHSRYIHIYSSLYTIHVHSIIYIFIHIIH